MLVLTTFVTQLARGASNQLINGVAKLVCDGGRFGEFELVFSSFPLAYRGGLHAGSLGELLLGEPLGGAKLL